MPQPRFENMSERLLCAGFPPRRVRRYVGELRDHFDDLVRWKAGHDALAARSTQGASLFVANSGHYIQVDQPQAVIDAIKKVVSEVRAAK